MKKIISDLLSQSEGNTISFQKFMETVLYHPKKGYYSRAENKIGSDGDFYTSSNVGDIFGRLLGRWFLQIFEKTSLPLEILEIGGGTGKIAGDLLSFIKEQSPAIANKLQYTIVERSPFHQDLQRQRLNDFKNVRFVQDIESINDFDGIVFSNELFDAFPVQIIEKKNGQLFELFVGMDEDSFIEKLKKLEDETILTYLHKYNVRLNEGQRLEIPLMMEHYFSSLLEKLNHAVLLTIDYGYTSEEWSLPEHRQGSIRGFYKHKLIEHPFSNLGEMDLTTHIHFDTLLEIGKEKGVHSDSLLEQSRFLLQAGILEELQECFDPNPFSEISKRNRAVRNMLLPGGISSYFRTLIQVKDFPIDVDNLFFNKSWLDTKIP
ncbi:class I SAM-dependent methyltransferase [Peribacillus alkalitolerans]|uniref:class I SAM-dependent methyltransferase n=1 Tax=Peribacillus alkalitolerans TaxID=1550385 RepID=UPI0013D168E1|nr:SAM-dependent methyltransferase [Peribacillus alkalitolerans]